DDQDKAYQLSKTFLSKFGTKDDEETKKVKEFVEKYQMATLGKKIEEGKTAEAFVFGKDVLTREPENSYITSNLAYADYQVFQTKKDKTFAQDSVQFAKQTLKLFEAKKLPGSFQPFTDEADATAIMYYIIGHFAVESNLPEAAQNFYKAIQFTSRIKNNSYPYYIIAYNYEKEYEKGAKAFEAKYPQGSPQTSEMKAEDAKLEKLLSRMQDAYARAVKLGESDNPSNVGSWKQRYAQVYEFINGSDKGSAEFLANVLTTPMPNPNAP
ncbi:MAG: hypothetical protein ABWZ66_13150, partial [Pyrinomonadaceae bacterium]